MSLPAAVLVANRGEIAVRIMRTLRRLGIRSVAVHHAVDARSRHVRDADAAVELTGTTPVAAYLDAEQIIAAARATGADAVHPGFGFLSERAAFAEAVAAAGIAFVGPPPDAIRAMGDKIESKRLAIVAGVPTLPGSQDALADVGEALAEAERIGYPVLLKASAGGGGKGMRIARSADQCREAFERASSEAAASFGDGRVFLERYVDRPRHIEIQVLADTHGTVVHLGERECSIQRRYQKVIEEAPSPFVSPQLRDELGAAAVSLARKVGYTSAGTVEMVMDTGGNAYFLEMNTRLQVEHPVTELVTGIDIVEQQLRVTAGEKLAFTQDDVTLTGSAIEARIYAEDAYAGFVPAIGPLRLVRFPSGPGIRVDHGVLQGDAVTAAFDPMIAKVVGHGATREEAIARLSGALRETVLLGTTTNTAFLADVVEHPDFAAGDTHTGFIDEHPALTTAAVADAETERFLLAAAALHSPRFDRRFDVPEAHARAGGVATVTLQISLGEPRAVRVTRSGDTATVWIDGVAFPARTRPDGGATDLTVDGRREQVWVAADRDTVFVHAFGRAWALEVVDPVEASLREGQGADAATAPMPGVLVAVSVAPGDEVAGGQVLAVIESMKMQTEIKAPRAGFVERVPLTVGESFGQGAPLVVLRPEEEGG